MATITTRAGKGSPLTNNELDANFTNLNSDKYESGSAASLASLAVTGVSTFSAGTVSAPAITTTGDTNTGIFFPAADTIAFTEGGVESMRINSSGQLDLVNNPILTGGTANGVTYLNGSKVLTSGSVLTFNGGGLGIGVASATQLLNLSGAGTSSIQIVSTDSGGKNLLLSVSGSLASIRELNGNPLTFDVANAEKMRIDSSGNVGIGTSSPASRLTVVSASSQAVIGLYNTVAAGGTGFSALRLGSSSGTNNWQMQYDNGSGALNFYDFTAASNRLTIDSSGNVGIGTSSPASYGKLSVENPTTCTITAAATGTGVVSTIMASNNSVAIGIAGTTSNHPYITITNNTERMRIDSSGNVGIGTASPAYKLSVNGRISYSGAIGEGADTTLSSTGTIVQHATSSTWTQQAFFTGGTERMRIDSSGNVGIGTSSPSFILDVRAPQGAIRNVSSTGTNPVDYRVVNTGGTTYFGRENSAGSAFGTTAYSTVIWSEGAYPTVFATNGSERMRIDSSGNLLLGGTNANFGYKQEITGTSASSPFPGLSIYNTSVNQGAKLAFLDGGNSAAIGNIAGSLLFYASDRDAERMRIDSSGNLLVGTSTRFYTEKLTVAQSANNAGIRVGNTNGSFTDYNYMSSASVAAGTGWSHFIGQSSDGATNNVIIYGNGNIQNANNSYGSLSDAKLKENIVDASPKLQKLLQVKVRNYNLKDDYEQHKQIGVIAQELEPVFPSMVEETADRDAEGNVLETTTKSVKYSVFVPILIKALQEQQALINDLTTRLTQLENK